MIDNQIKQTGQFTSNLHQFNKMVSNIKNDYNKQIYSLNVIELPKFVSTGVLLYIRWLEVFYVFMFLNSSCQLNMLRLLPFKAR